MRKAQPARHRLIPLLQTSASLSQQWGQSLCQPLRQGSCHLDPGDLGLRHPHFFSTHFPLPTLGTGPRPNLAKHWVGRLGGSTVGSKKSLSFSGITTAHPYLTGRFEESKYSSTIKGSLVIIITVGRFLTTWCWEEGVTDKQTDMERKGKLLGATRRVGASSELRGQGWASKCSQHGDLWGHYLGLDQAELQAWAGSLGLHREKTGQGTATWHSRPRAKSTAAW